MTWDRAKNTPNVRSMFLRAASCAAANILPSSISTSTIVSWNMRQWEAKEVCKKTWKVAVFPVSTCFMFSENMYKSINPKTVWFSSMSISFILPKPLKNYCRIIDSMSAIASNTSFFSQCSKNSSRQANRQSFLCQCSESMPSKSTKNRKLCRLKECDKRSHLWHARNTSPKCS